MEMKIFNTALRPSLATTQGPLLMTSSPSLLEGITYRLHKRHYGPAGDSRVVIARLHLAN